ncbi:MAG TPA: hypothetical protein VJC09_02925 [Candidatus Saccharimonadales bacterium]|nr:hypothetical protein [Candidatus Saccharimonadales bacterium]
MPGDLEHIQQSSTAHLIDASTMSVQLEGVDHPIGRLLVPGEATVGDFIDVTKELANRRKRSEMGLCFFDALVELEDLTDWVSKDPVIATKRAMLDPTRPQLPFGKPDVDAEDTDVLGNFYDVYKHFSQPHADIAIAMHVSEQYIGMIELPRGNPVPGQPVIELPDYVSGLGDQKYDSGLRRDNVSWLRREISSQLHAPGDQVREPINGFLRFMVNVMAIENAVAGTGASERAYREEQAERAQVQLTEYQASPNAGSVEVETLLRHQQKRQSRLAEIDRNVSGTHRALQDLFGVEAAELPEGK